VQSLKNFPAFYVTRRFIAIFKEPFTGPIPETVSTYCNLIQEIIFYSEI
jgi:hypothetical protein